MFTNPNNNEPRDHRTNRWLFGALALASLGVFVIGMFVTYGGQNATAEPAIPSGASITSWKDNGQGAQYLLQIFDGSAPLVGVTVSGIVMSDTMCKPDAKGLSHCHNAIKLADGSYMTVIDTHQMDINPCLQPGQKLTLRTIAPYWMMATLSR